MWMFVSWLTIRYCVHRQVCQIKWQVSALTPGNEWCVLRIGWHQVGFILLGGKMSFSSDISLQRGSMNVLFGNSTDLKSTFFYFAHWAVEQVHTHSRSTVHIPLSDSITQLSHCPFSHHISQHKQTLCLCKVICNPWQALSPSSTKTRTNEWMPSLSGLFLVTITQLWVILIHPLA